MNSYKVCTLIIVQLYMIYKCCNMHCACVVVVVSGGSDSM